MFWDLYCAAPERRDTCEHSSEAKAFHDYVSRTRARETAIYIYNEPHRKNLILHILKNKGVDQLHDYTVIVQLISPFVFAT